MTRRNSRGTSSKRATSTPSDVVEAAGSVRIAADAVGRPADLPRDATDIRHEALPKRRDSLVRLEPESIAEPGDEKAPARLEARRLEVDDQRVIHSDDLHQMQIAEMALRADGFGSPAELVAEGTGKGLVRTIAGIESHGQDIRRPGRKPPGRLGQAAAAQIADDRAAGRRAENPHELVARDARELCDRLQRNILGELALDEPERLADRVHESVPSRAAATMPASRNRGLIDLAREDA